MRHSIIVASALAVGAAANSHLDHRARRYRILTETEYTTVTVIVTVTAGALGQATGTLGVASTSATTTSNPLLPSFSLQSQPPASTSLSLPSGVGAPIGGSLTSSSTVTISSSSSATLTPSIAGIPSSPSSSVNTPVSSSAASTSASSFTAPAASPSPAPGSIGPDHISGPSQASLTSGTDYMNAILYHHNAARANHGSPPLVWDTACETNAALAAQMCNFAHYVPAGAGQGQNLFTVSGSVFNVTAGITESWYKGEFPAMIGHFGEASLSDDVFHQVGHLTQVVWKSTTGVGCVSLDCGANMKVNGATSNLNKFTVCNYAPAGNIATLYADNVGSPISTTNLGNWAD